MSAHALLPDVLTPYLVYGRPNGESSIEPSEGTPGVAAYVRRVIYYGGTCIAFSAWGRNSRKLNIDQASVLYYSSIHHISPHPANNENFRRSDISAEPNSTRTQVKTVKLFFVSYPYNV